MPSMNAEPGTRNAEHQKMRVDHATRTFLDGEVIAFQDLCLEVAPNEALCVVGPSGCGKTTLLRCMAGLLQPSEGQVFLDERPVTAPHPNVAMVFQHSALFPRRPASKNGTNDFKLPA